ncbi:DUF4837 family protein [Flavobacteriaceae bacterium]|nr:DUF4837 family protein [Flavobacteriaceae bacterium]MDA9984629.1 DUF4837 family protein [Flavobacteriaceae bacterium]
MKKTLFFLLFIGIISCDNGKQQAYVPDSSGNLNNITVVMPKSFWEGSLGKTVHNEIATLYEGLPIDEPRFTLRYLEPKAFTGFGRHGRNVIWFRKDSLNSFQLAQNQFARPQILAQVRGEDQEIMGEYIKENAALLIGTFQENERVEKIRRIAKSSSKDQDFQTKFGVSLTYPTAYSTVKDTTNFLWLEKPVRKGTLNIIAYALPIEQLEEFELKTLTSIRDSIGALHVPGRLPNTHMITEKAYRPYFYSTSLAGQKAYLTKGMWEVKKDFMAGPFVNYILKDTLNKRAFVIEGFTFAPSVAKRDYMFELNSIISTMKIERAEKN